MEALPLSKLVVLVVLWRDPARIVPLVPWVTLPLLLRPMLVVLLLPVLLDGLSRPGLCQIQFTMRSDPLAILTILAIPVVLVVVRGRWDLPE